MFPHGYFQAQYFIPNYWPPIERVSPFGAYIAATSRASAPFSLPPVETARLIQRIRDEIRRRQEGIPAYDEDAALLLLLSDVFGSIGGVERRLISISEDSEAAILLALTSDPLSR